MQLALRQSSDRNRGRDIHMMVGVAECAPEEIVEEQISTYGFEACRGGGLALADTGQRHAPDDASWSRCADVADMVRQPVWPVPVSGECALLFFRRSVAAPTVPGNVSLVFSGLLFTAPEHAPHVDPRSIQVLSGTGNLSPLGRLGQDINERWDIPDMVEATRGDSLTGFFRRPLWGFGAEPVAYPSTMHLDAIAGFSRIMELQLRDDLSADELSGLRDLRRSVSASEPDPLYLQTLKAMVRQNPGIDLPARITRVQTADEVTAAARQMRRALAGGLIGDENLLPEEPGTPTFR